VAPPPLTESEVRQILLALEPLSADRRIVLVGGQAVAFWTRFLAARSSDPELRLPLASKDIDFEGAARAVIEAAILLAGEARTLDRRPHAEHRGRALRRRGWAPANDRLHRKPPWSARPRRTRHGGATARRERRWGTRDPGLGDASGAMHGEPDLQRRRAWQDRAAGHASATRVDRVRPCVVCGLLDCAPAEHQPARAVLRLNERVFRKSLRDRSFRNVFVWHGIDPLKAVLVDERLPERFRSRRYPDMARQLCDQRERDLSNRPPAKRAGAP
jgi:hypothetical protein